MGPHGKPQQPASADMTDALLQRFSKQATHPITGVRSWLVRMMKLLARLARSLAIADVRWLGSVVRTLYVDPMGSINSAFCSADHAEVMRHYQRRASARKEVRRAFTSISSDSPRYAAILQVVLTDHMFVVPLLPDPSPGRAAQGIDALGALRLEHRDDRTQGTTFRPFGPTPKRH
jgi:hypothetical protein